MKLRTVAITLALFSASFTFGQSHSGNSLAPNPDETAIHDYVLTMDKINKYAEFMKKIESAAKSDPALKVEMKKIGDTDMHLVDKVKMIQNSPHASRFLATQGITAHDVVFAPMTLLTASLAKVAQEQGGKPPAYVNPANIQFVKQHSAEIQNLHLSSDDSDQ